MAPLDASERALGAPRRRVAQVLAVLAAHNLGWAAFLLIGNFPPPEGAEFAPLPDFAAFWAAARLAVEATPWLAYDPLVHRAVEEQGLGHQFDGMMQWYYPPLFQLLLFPIGALPLAPAMALWIIGGLVAFLHVCRRILRDRLAMLGGLAAAPTLLNIVNGQTGFFVAALVGFALLERERWPTRSGAALATLAIKPHVAFAVPLALLAAGRWRVLGAAVMVLAVFIAASVLVLGTATWNAFFANFGATAEALTGGAERRWEIHPTVYGMLRLAGAGFGPALALHAVPALIVFWLTLRAWRLPAISPDICAALVCFASAVVMPRLLHYDLHIVTIGVLFQLRHSLRHGTFRGEAALIGAAMLAAALSVFHPPPLMPLVAPALFIGCLFGHARSALPAPPRSAVPSGRRSWGERG